MSRGRRAWILLVAVLLASCSKLNMADQRKAKNWDRNSFFAHDTVMQAPPPGTLAHSEPGAPAPQPPRIDMALLQRGQQQFDIACTPCHGMTGDGYGMIVQRGFPRPPTLYSDRLRHFSAQNVYDVITHGKGKMFGYADRVAPADRWAVVAYVRALQASASTPTAKLDTADLAALSAATQLKKAGG
jgi:mono/diheme cytochrome c family protein